MIVSSISYSVVDKQKIVLYYDTLGELLVDRLLTTAVLLATPVFGNKSGRAGCGILYSTTCAF